MTAAIESARNPVPSDGALRLRLQVEVAIEEIESIAECGDSARCIDALKQIAVVVQSQIDRARCEQLAANGATT